MLKLFSSNFPFMKLLYVKGLCVKGGDKMKKYLICITLIILCLSGCTEYSDEKIDVTSSSIEKNNTGTTLAITVILNGKPSSKDYEDCSRSIIQHCIDNNFKSTRFSYDVSGYPTTLEGTVYATKNDIKKNKICYTFHYYPSYKNSSSKYTINDASKNYTLEIKK